MEKLAEYVCEWCEKRLMEKTIKCPYCGKVGRVVPISPIHLARIPDKYD